MKRTGILIFLGLFGLLFSCTDTNSQEKTMGVEKAAELPIPEGTPAAKIVPLDEADRYFDEFRLKGSFIWYDLQADQYHAYHQELLDSSFSPASTFKIMNALIALETGVVVDTLEVIPWDNVKRGYDKWNADQTLGSALRYSAVWAFQNIARRVHAQDSGSYLRYLRMAQYGNKTISDDIGLFWLDNSLQISPMQQIDFLRKLYRNRLPFSHRSMQLVKEIIHIKTTPTYTMRGKTGWGILGERDICWYIGYVETKTGIYFYCTNAESIDPIKGNGDFKRRYVGVTEALVEALVSGELNLGE